MSEHPLRLARVRAYQETKAPFACVAHFEPFGSFPMLFRGCSETDVRARAEAFRTEQLEKHEAAYIARQEAAAKARAARAAKDARPDPVALLEESET